MPKLIPKPIEDCILNLHSNGLLHIEIATKLGVHWRTVEYCLKKHGLKSNKPKFTVVDDKNARCSKCGKIKPFEAFAQMHGKYRLSYCQSCRGKQGRENLNNHLDRYLAERWRRLKKRCEHEGYDFDIGKEYFIELYRKQNGKCFYFGVDLNTKVRPGQRSGPVENSLSVDRLIKSGGYTEGNIVMCSQRANTIKSNLTLDELKSLIPSWYEKIQKFYTKDF